MQIAILLIVVLAGIILLAIVSTVFLDWLEDDPLTAVPVLCVVLALIIVTGTAYLISHHKHLGAPVSAEKQ